VTGGTIDWEEDAMAVLEMPYLAAGRDQAAAWVRMLGPIDGGRVVVNANPTLSTSASFAGQLVRSALVDRNAAELVLVGGPAEFANAVKLAGDELGVTERLRFAADDPELYPDAATVIVAPDRGLTGEPG
jgi:hypothetical protein